MTGTLPNGSKAGRGCKLDRPLWHLLPRSIARLIFRRFATLDINGLDGSLSNNATQSDAITVVA